MSQAFTLDSHAFEAVGGTLVLHAQLDSDGAEPVVLESSQHLAVSIHYLRHIHGHFMPFDELQQLVVRVLLVELDVVQWSLLLRKTNQFDVPDKRIWHNIIYGAHLASLHLVQQRSRLTHEISWHKRVRIEGFTLGSLIDLHRRAERLLETIGSINDATVIYHAQLFVANGLLLHDPRLSFNFSDNLLVEQLLCVHFWFEAPKQLE